MILRQPFADVARQQERLLAIDNQELLTPCRDRLERPRTLSASQLRRVGRLRILTCVDFVPSEPKKAQPPEHDGRWRRHPWRKSGGRKPAPSGGVGGAGV